MSGKRKCHLRNMKCFDFTDKGAPGSPDCTLRTTDLKDEETKTLLKGLVGMEGRGLTLSL